MESTRLLDGPQAHERDRDFADDPNRMNLRTLERYLEDLRWEPPWRQEADQACDQYDGNQLDHETLAALKERGLGALIRNMIKPTIDTIIGLEEKTRTDWRVTSDYDDEMDVVDALGVKLAEAEKATNADKEISDAYGSMVKAGFSVVEVSRSSNPFHFPYRVQALHRREIYWDPRSRRNDWSDARFLVRKRWFDVDVAAAYFPKHKEVLKFSLERWESWEAQMQFKDDSSVTEFAQSWEIERGTKIDEMQWLDYERRQVCIFEVWYRTFHRGRVLKLPRGRVVEYNPANGQHLALVQAGIVQPQEAVYDKFRCAFFAGPHRLADFGTTRRNFPYVPFWGYREDLTGAPYGHIRSMVSTQQEINARVAKMMWLLSARRTLIDADALQETENTHSDASYEIGRTDGYIVLNPNRRNGPNAIRVDENLELAEAQRVALMDAIGSMSQISGVYSTMMGQSGTTTAARAIERLLDAGTTSLAEMNGNYLWARKEVGNRLLDLVKQDATKPEAVGIDTGTNKRQVYINRKAIDPNTGMPITENNVANTQVKLTLADTPSSPSHREAQFAYMTEFMKSLPDEMQAVLAPFLLENSNMAKRKEMAKVLREKFGILDPKSPEAAEAQKKAEQMELAQAQQLAKRFDAEVAEIVAKGEKLSAEAQKIRVEAGIDTGQTEAIMKLKADFQKQAMDLQKKVLIAEADREVERHKVELMAEAEALKSQDETEREKLRIASQERIAAMNSAVDDKVAKFRDALSDLSEEVDDRLEAIKQESKNERVKEQAARAVKDAKTETTIEKKIAGIDKKVAVAKASKPKPAAKK